MRCYILILLWLCMVDFCVSAQEHGRIEYYFGNETHQYLEDFIKGHKINQPDSEFCLVIDSADGPQYRHELKLGVYKKLESPLINDLINSTQRYVALSGGDIPVLAQDDITFGFIDGKKVKPTLIYPRVLILEGPPEKIVDIRVNDG